MSKIILKLWIPVVIWMGVIFILSSIPGEEIPKITIPHIDKIAHFLEYSILGFLLMRAFLKSWVNMNFAKMMVLAVIIGSSYAITDELHQQFTSGRMPDIVDFIADFIGLNIGIFVYKQRARSCQ